MIGYNPIIEAIKSGEYESAIEQINHSTGPASEIGAMVTAITPGHAEGETIIAPCPVNAFSAVCNGPLYILAETIAYLAALSSTGTAVTISTNMDFLTDGYSGRVVCMADLQPSDDGLSIIKVSLLDDNSSSIAEGTFIFQTVSPYVSDSNQKHIN